MTQPNDDADEASLMRQMIKDAERLEAQLRNDRSAYEAAQAHFEELVLMLDEELAKGLAPVHLQADLEAADRRLLHMEAELEKLILRVSRQLSVASC